jgi:multicomponent K+:H+ antiporter subunit F
MMNLLHVTIIIAQIMLAVSFLLSVYRLIKGPNAQDRIQAADNTYLIAMLLTLTFGIRYGSDMYYESALIIASIGFVSTVALSKFLLRGEVIE